MSAELTFGSVQLNSDTYEDWQKQIIYQKKHYRDPNSKSAQQRQKDVEKRQSDLFTAVDEGPGAVEDYLFREALNIENFQKAREAVPKLPKPLTINEMTRIPIQAERELYKSLHDRFTPAQATQPAIWALCHAVWMADGKFGSDIATVFLTGGRANTQEAQTRNFLRRTGGLRPIRGNVSPLVNCPLSVAWWRCRTAYEVTETVQAQDTANDVGTTIDVETAHEVLWQTEVWSNLVGMSVRQVTAVCAPRARAAAVVALHRRGSRAKKQKEVRHEIQGAIRALGRLSYGHNLQVVSWETLLATASDGAKSALEAYFSGQEEE